MTYKIGTVTLTGISKETVRKFANLTAFTMPLSNSNLCEVYDYSGAQLEITLDGHYTDTSLANIRTWVNSLHSILDGEQTSAVAYESDLLFPTGATINVKIDEIQIEYASEITGIYGIRYTLKLLQTV